MSYLKHFFRFMLGLLTLGLIAALVVLMLLADVVRRRLAPGRARAQQAAVHQNSS